jgi:hypothetical protein
MAISQKFKTAVKMDKRRQYQLAWEAGLNPTTLSQIITGYIRPRFGDQRVIRVGALLGLNPKECFEGFNLDHEKSDDSIVQESSH